MALPSGVPVDMLEGDLVSISAAMLEGRALVSLRALLQSSDSWSPDFAVPGVPGEWAWILTGEERFLFEVLPGRRIAVRADLADRLRVPARELVLRPANPEISDHAFKGVASRNVLAALRTDAGHRYADPRAPLCFIDARPVMLSVDVQVCAGGMLNVRDLKGRHQHRCPPGFHVTLSIADTAVPATVDVAGIQDGAVVRVTYSPDNSRDSSTDDSDGDSGGGDSGQAGPPRDLSSRTPGSAGEGPPRRNTARSVRPDHGEAGTGGFPSGLYTCGDPQRGQHVPAFHMFTPCRFRDTTSSWDPTGEDIRPRQFYSLYSTRRRVFNLVVALACAVAFAVGSICTVCAFKIGPASGSLRLSVLSVAVLLCQCRAAGIEGPKSLFADDRDLRFRSRPIPTPCRAPLSIFSEAHNTEMLSQGTLQVHRGGRSSSSSAASYPREAQVLMLESLIGSPTQPVLRPLASWPKGLRVADTDKQAESVLGDEVDKPLAFGSTPVGFTPRQLHALFRPTFSSLSLGECLLTVQGKLKDKLYELLQGHGGDLPEGHDCFTDGSFTPGGKGESPLIGWSCVFVDRDQQICDVLSGCIPLWGQELEGCPSAFQAECWALLVALWIGVSSWQGEPFSIMSDCQSALAVARGEVAVQTYGIARILGHVAGCCRDVARGGPNLCYVPGHGGRLATKSRTSLPRPQLLGPPPAPCFGPDMGTLTGGRIREPSGPGRGLSPDGPGVTTPCRHP